METNPSKVLIIKPGAIGDLLHLSPTVRALKRHYPAAQIDIMVASKATVALFQNNPQVHRILCFDRKGEHRSWGRFRELWQEVRSGNYDWVINFQRSTLKVWLLILAAFPCRVLVYHKSRTRLMHAVVNHLETIAPLGIDPENEPLDLEMFLGPEDVAQAESLVNAGFCSGRPLVALNLGASNRIKCWAPASFAALAFRVRQELGADVLLIGGKDELDLAAEVRRLCPVTLCDFTGKLTLGELGAVLQRCTVLVSGDTGPLHMSTAVGTPVVALFGAIDPDRTGPVGNGNTVISHNELACVPCNSKKCNHSPYLECMTLISVDEVYEAVVRYF